MNKHQHPASNLTIIIQTRNEAENIIDCLRSCQDIADEILVVDMSSTDQTCELAKKMGAKVVSIADEGFVEPARQFAIEQATSNWIFILDADERLTPALSHWILNYLKHPQQAVVQFPRQNIMFGKWMKHGLLWPDYQIRLFKKDAVKWPATIHSKPQFKKELLSVPAIEENSIVHYHSVNLRQRLLKMNDQALHENFYESHPHLTPLEVYERMETEFPKRFFDEEGYQDGMRGFINAKLMEYYRLIEFAEYWEKTGYQELLSASDLKKMWTTDRQLIELIHENQQLRDAKIYQMYESLKKTLAKIKKNLDHKS